jgi:transposase
MPGTTRVVVGGVDTHKDFHLAVVVDPTGKILDTNSFPATAAGYPELLAWMASFGEVARLGVEGTGAYGAGLARHLAAEGVAVLEVNRPNRRARRRRGKSDTIDAGAAGRAALNGEATVLPEAQGGLVESIRALRSSEQLSREELARCFEHPELPSHKRLESDRSIRAPNPSDQTPLESSPCPSLSPLRKPVRRRNWA